MLEYLSFDLTCRSLRYASNRDQIVRKTLTMLNHLCQCVLECKRRIRLLNVGKCTQSPTGPPPGNVIGSKPDHR
jgi:hypothetical protein